MGAGTLHYDVADLATHENLREWVPAWCFAFIRWALRQNDGRCSLKLDWFAGRGIEPAPGTSPKVVAAERDLRPVSDHDPISSIHQSSPGRHFKTRPRVKSVHAVSERGPARAGSPLFGGRCGTLRLLRRFRLRRGSQQPSMSFDLFWPRRLLATRPRRCPRPTSPTAGITPSVSPTIPKGAHSRHRGIIRRANCGRDLRVNRLPSAIGVPQAEHRSSRSARKTEVARPSGPRPSPYISLMPWSINTARPRGFPEFESILKENAGMTGIILVRAVEQPKKYLMHRKFFV